MKRVGSWRDVYDRMRQMQRIVNALSRNGRKILMSDLAFCVPHDAFSYRTAPCSAKVYFGTKTRCHRLHVLDILHRMTVAELKLRKKIERRQRDAGR